MTELSAPAAYQKGWAASGRPPHDMEAAEERFTRRHGETLYPSWHHGWMDRATGRDYGHLLRCASCEVCGGIDPDCANCELLTQAEPGENNDH